MIAHSWKSIKQLSLSSVEDFKNHNDYKKRRRHTKSKQLLTDKRHQLPWQITRKNFK